MLFRSKELSEYRKMVEPYVCDTSAYLYEAVQAGKNILLEGQLGSLKDPDHGIYPMVTSSSTLAAFGAIGAGIPPYEIKKIITVCKAYSSAVGAGAFVSEIFGQEAEELRRRGGDKGEFGATTGLLLTSMPWTGDIPGRRRNFRRCWAPDPGFQRPAQPLRQPSWRQPGPSGPILPARLQPVSTGQPTLRRE